MNAAAIHLQSQHNTMKKFEGPIHLDVTFFFEYPSSMAKSKRLMGSFKHTKSDLSNLIKFVEDIAIGVLYDDDSIIASISAKKVYDSKSRTEFTITLL